MNDPCLRCFRPSKCTHHRWRVERLRCEEYFQSAARYEQMAYHSGGNKNEDVHLNIKEKFR